MDACDKCPKPGALVELAGLMQKCAFFIGHDSGISHLAAALGLPGIVLWGVTAEEIWRPPSENMVVLRHPAGLAQLAVTTVIETLDKLAPTVRLAVPSHIS